MSSKAEICIRAMTSFDITAAVKLSHLAGWNQTPSDWQLILAQNSNNNWVAEKEGRIIATTTSINYDNIFEWIGMVLVDPNYRRQGIGNKLIKQVINATRAPCLRLDASEMGQYLYKKNGFIEKSKILRLCLQRTSSAIFPSNHRIQPITETNFHEVLAFDEALIGYDRSKILSNFYHRNPANAWLWKDSDQINGYGLLRNGHRSLHIGPLVARNMDVARLLLSVLLSSAKKDVSIDVFADDMKWVSLLINMGFTVLRDFRRMEKGSCRNILDDNHPYAIAGPAIG